MKQGNSIFKGVRFENGRSYPVFTGNRHFKVDQTGPSLFALPGGTVDLPLYTTFRELKEINKCHHTFENMTLDNT